MADAAIVISVALQCGVSTEALARSVARLPDGPIEPERLDSAKDRAPASAIGATLDMLRGMEG